MAYLQMMDGTQLYYREEGHGKPIVMAHGWKASSDAYSKIIERLLTDYRCIAYDQRGHLHSSVPMNAPTMEDLASDLNEMIQKLCPDEKPMLIGWSMGGATVLEYVRQYGCESIDRILIVDFVPKMLSDESWRLGRLGGRYDEAELCKELAFMKQDFYSFLAKYYGESNPSFSTMSQSEQEEMVLTRMKDHNPAVLTSLWESLCRADYRQTLPKITVPVRVFHASILPLCPPEAAQFYKQQIPGDVDTVQFENASHSLMIEYPDLFCSLVKEFYM